MLRTVVACTLAVFLATVLAAQPPEPPEDDGPDRGAHFDDPAGRWVHQQWTVADGLPVNALTDVVQTVDGWLWVATLDGLVRFDGVRFTRFDTVAVPALRSNRIIRLLAAEDGLWILSEQGHLTWYASGRFNAVEPLRGESPLGVKMALGEDGALWLATRNGLHRARKGRFDAAPSELVGESISAVAVGASGRVWLATFTGRVAVLEDGAPRWTTARLDPGTNNVLHLAEDADGVLWLGTREGLFRYRHQTLEKVRDVEIARRAVAAGALASHSGGYRPIIWSSQWPISRFLLQGPEGVVWESTGLSLRGDGRELLRLPADGDQILRMTFDREGTAWLATNTQGLHALRPARVAVFGEAQGLAHKNVYSLHQDRRGTVWISDHNGGLTRTDCKASTQGEMMPMAAGGTIYDDPGSGWLLRGTRSGPYRLVDSGTVDARWAPFAAVSMSHPHVALEDDVRAILRTRDGRLLLGKGHGLWESRPNGPHGGRWQFRRVEATAGWQVRVLLEDLTDAVWLGTNGAGLARYRKGAMDRVTTADGLSSDLVRALYQDAEGHLWIGTEDRGLARLVPASLDRPGDPELARIQKRHGLWDDSLHHILEDDAGWLWISSNRGVFRVRRAQLEDFIAGRVDRVDSVAYTEKDGMRHREANGGRQGAGLRACDGRFWFPTQDGVAIFDPQELSLDLPPPPVEIERLTAGDREILPGGSAGSTMILEAVERSFEIEYTALSFRAPDRLLFRYRLGGYDERWAEAGGRRQAFFTKVPPGTYSFRVQARFADGPWGREGATLVLSIRPFFWETGWFRGTLAVLLLAAVAGGIYVRERGQRRRRRYLERQVAERTRELAAERDTVAAQARKLTELDRAKSELFANVSHEFRTPLTLSLGPLQDLIEGRLGALEPPVVRELEGVHANSARLLELVGQLLDVARLDAGGLELRPALEDLDRFVERLGERFVALAERRRIDYSVTVPTAAVEAVFDREQLDKVLTNLLSNAFKFSRRNDSVTLDLCAPRQNWVEITVTDTGRGTAASELRRIFGRFYRAESAARRQVPGTGLGLALARDLVELHGGTLEADSVLGEGSTFTVRLPLGNPLETPPAREDDTEESSSEEASKTAAFAARAVEAALLDGDPENDGSALDDTGTRATDVTTVLVVDDHPDLRGYVRRHLGEHYRVVEAGDGAEGLATARRVLPDLVVSDVMMPEMDGFELTRALKQDPELDFVPVVLLTARAEAEDKLAGLGLGADDYLTKPFDVRELVARVDNLIAQRRQLRQRFLEEARRAGDREAGDGGQESDFLSRVVAEIDLGLADEDFQIDALARCLALSRTLLYERLAEVTETSPARLILERRMTRAAALLREEANVSETAYAVGFKSVSHFCQRFRRHFSVTPSAFRRAA